MSNRDPALQSARMLIAKAKRHISRQKELIETLESSGYSTRLTYEILAEYERTLKNFEDRLTQLLKR